MAFTTSDICKIILAIFLPPLGVFLERGCGADFFINILLTILGYIPGIIHGKPSYLMSSAFISSIRSSPVHHSQILVALMTAPPTMDIMYFIPL
ncbi:hypothetical protein HYPSUDRAFT_198281 [Hypholoma sublateritium FD-334 SS-4]|uniref:Plasma membrane proteolipid 3 n=1 Tax=Hypholoma sublateritium (strain FD-334 SS-4) TaxID=945553 RepID=A0A0D2P9E1_HYPSF|nr:hypothetical protein HYPSUDRAFT_198281 [Hypholoma sublateritium FD-334 SS-4]